MAPLISQWQVLFPLQQDNITELGNNILMHVCQAMQYGNATPSVAQGFPVGGYLVQSMTEAVVMAIKLYSITVSSMADEQTMSVVAWLECDQTQLSTCVNGC